MSWKCTRKGVTHPEGTDLVSVVEVSGPWNAGWDPCGTNWSELEGNVLGIIECASKGVELPARSPILGELPCGISIYWEWDATAVDRLELEGALSMEIGGDTNRGEIACATQAVFEARTFICETLHRLRGTKPIRRPGPVSDWVLVQREHEKQHMEIADTLWRSWLEKLKKHRSAGPNPRHELTDGQHFFEVLPERMLRNEVFGELLDVFGKDARGQRTAKRWLQMADDVLDGKRSGWGGRDLEDLSKALSDSVCSPKK
jgi:hypothetical protein